MTSQEPSDESANFSERGFSLIEILMSIMLISILTYVTLEYVNNSVTDARFDETVQEMNTITIGIVGDPKMQEGGTRTSFGYFGDVGALPASIGSLLTLPAGVSAYSVSSAARTGFGWNGPYLKSGDSNIDYTTDAWGTAYSYSSASASLTSYGADKVSGGTNFNQDIVLTFPSSERLATVTGFVSNAGGPELSAQVELNYPDGSGGLTQSLQTVAAGGSFSYSNVPYGVRSITVYKPTKAAVTTTVGPVVITVDKPKVFVPAAQLDVNP